MTPCTFKVTDVYKTPSNCFYRLFVLFMHFSSCLLQFEPFYILGIRFSTWRYKGIAVNPINKETASSRQLQVIGPYFQSPEMNTALITKQSFSCFSLYVRVFGGPAQSGIAELCISIVETCRQTSAFWCIFTTGLHTSCNISRVIWKVVEKYHSKTWSPILLSVYMVYAHSFLVVESLRGSGFIPVMC